MVCNRCIMMVQNELDKLDLSAISLKLGEIVFEKEPTNEEKKKLEEALSALGFQVIDDKKSRIIEKIKNTIIELVHHQHNEAKTNLSDILSTTLHNDYNYLSNLFFGSRRHTWFKIYVTLGSGFILFFLNTSLFVSLPERWTELYPHFVL